MSLTRDDVAKAIEDALIEVRFDALDSAFLAQGLIVGSIVAAMLNADANDEREYILAKKGELDDLTTHHVFENVLEDKDVLSEKISTATKIANEILSKMSMTMGPNGIEFDS